MISPHYRFLSHFSCGELCHMKKFHITICHVEKFLHMADFFSTNMLVVLETNIRYALDLNFNCEFRLLVFGVWAWHSCFHLADYPALSVDRAGGGNPLYAGDTPIQEFLIWCAPIQEFLNRCAPIQEFLIWCAGQLEKKHSFCRFLAHFLASSVLCCRQHVCQANIQKKKSELACFLSSTGH